MTSPVRYLDDSAYSALPVQERWLHEMRALVGSHEDWGPNRSKRIDEIEAHWGLKGEPYCIMACGHALLKAGVKLSDLPAGWPLVANAVKWARHQGRWTQEPARGRVFAYVKSSGKGHAGAVTGVLRSGALNTIQANTGAVGDSREGDGIYEKPLKLATLQQYPTWGFIDVSGLA